IVLEASLSRETPQQEPELCANRKLFESQHRPMKSMKWYHAISCWFENCHAGLPSFLHSPTRKSRNGRRNHLTVSAFILDSHVQALKHTRSPNDIQEPPASYCGYPQVDQSRIDRFSSIRMNGTYGSIHNRYKTWAN